MMNNKAGQSREDLLMMMTMSEWSLGENGWVDGLGDGLLPQEIGRELTNRQADGKKL